MDRPRNETDDVVSIIDPETGYALNKSVQEQGFPFWWEAFPNIYSRIRSERARLGIVVVDFPDGPPKRVETIVTGTITPKRPRPGSVTQETQ